MAWNKYTSNVDFIHIWREGKKEMKRTTCENRLTECHRIFVESQHLGFICATLHWIASTRMKHSSAEWTRILNSHRWILMHRNIETCWNIWNGGMTNIDREASGCRLIAVCPLSMPSATHVWDRRPKPEPRSMPLHISIMNWLRFLGATRLLCICTFILEIESSLLPSIRTDHQLTDQSRWPLNSWTVARKKNFYWINKKPAIIMIWCLWCTSNGMKQKTRKSDCVAHIDGV